MAEVLLSLGSNIDRERNIRSCVDELAAQFGHLDISPVYESEAVGFDGDNFLNLVVAIHTDATVAELSRRLRDIENAHGRDRQTPKFSARSLDIDILTYDQLVGEVDGVQLPRKEIFRNAFVLRPMADLRPQSPCPGAENSYLELWQKFDAQDQRLWQVPFTFGS